MRSAAVLRSLVSEPLCEFQDYRFTVQIHTVQIYIYTKKLSSVAPDPWSVFTAEFLKRFKEELKIKLNNDFSSVQSVPGIETVGEGVNNVIDVLETFSRYVLVTI